VTAPTYMCDAAMKNIAEGSERALRKLVGLSN
jgi:hypothetical protein